MFYYYVQPCEIVYSQAPLTYKNGSFIWFSPPFAASTCLTNYLSHSIIKKINLCKALSTLPGMCSINVTYHISSY